MKTNNVISTSMKQQTKGVQDVSFVTTSPVLVFLVQMESRDFSSHGSQGPLGLIRAHHSRSQDSIHYSHPVFG
jgi:hypothetical protein